MLQNLVDTRIKAFLLHLVFSALIAFTVILAAVLIWYPDSFLDATGAKKIFLMIIGIDVCIGPILTLAVFNKKKKELNRDLNIIFFIQICALVYGIYTITIARPVYVVFAIDRFELVQANEITNENQLEALDKQFKTLPLFSPKWISSHLPDDVDERNDLLFNAIDTGNDIAQLPKYYRDYQNSVTEIKKRALPLSNLMGSNPSKHKLVHSLIQKFPDDNKYGYIPLAGRKASLTVIIDKDTGQPVELSNLNPWQDQ